MGRGDEGAAGGSGDGVWERALPEIGSFLMTKA